MPQKYRPHVALFEGFTFPIVKKIIDTNPLPKAIEHIPSPFKDGLVATLACELASISVYIVMQGRRSDWEHETERRLLQQYGGTSYWALTREMETINASQQAVRDEQRNLSGYCTGFADSGITPLPNTTTAAGPYGDRVHWRYDVHPAEKIDAIRRDVRRLLQREAKLRRRGEIVVAEMAKLSASIQTTAAYRDAARLATWEQADADFELDPTAQPSGAAYYLRNNEHNWWVKFTGRFRAECRRYSCRLRLALREPLRVRAIEAGVTPKIYWDLAAANYLSATAADWGGPRGALKSKAIESARAKLRKEDRDGIEWLTRRGRRFNFYTLWLAQQHAAANSNARPHLNINLKCLSDVLRVHAPTERENPDWRLNELSWVLSRRQSKIYPFVPTTSAQHPRAAWDEHLKTWWGDIEAARTGETVKNRSKKLVSRACRATDPHAKREKCTSSPARRSASPKVSASRAN